MLYMYKYLTFLTLLVGVLVYQSRNDVKFTTIKWVHY